MTGRQSIGSRVQFAHLANDQGECISAGPTLHSTLVSVTVFICIQCHGAHPLAGHSKVRPTEHQSQLGCRVNRAPERTKPFSCASRELARVGRLWPLSRSARRANFNSSPESDWLAGSAHRNYPPALPSTGRSSTLCLLISVPSVARVHCASPCMRAATNLAFEIWRHRRARAYFVATKCSSAQLECQATGEAWRRGRASKAINQAAPASPIKMMIIIMSERRH